MNVGRSELPILYIPEKDGIQEVVDSGTNTEVNIAPQGGVAHPCLFIRDPEEFLVHIQQALNAIRQKGLQSALEKATKDKEEWMKKLTMAIEVFGNYKGRDENTPKKKAVDKATEAVTDEEETMESLIAHTANELLERLVLLLDKL